MGFCAVIPSLVKCEMWGCKDTASLLFFCHGSRVPVSRPTRLPLAIGSLLNMMSVVVEGRTQYLAGVVPEALAIEGNGENAVRLQPVSHSLY